MSNLPEWLWPLEDEEAVQKAERLIEETHNALQRMEADMNVQRCTSEELAVKTEKLKYAVNNKIKILEKELKGFSEPQMTDKSVHEKPKRPLQQAKEAVESKQLKENLLIMGTDTTTKTLPNKKSALMTHNTLPSSNLRSHKPKSIAKAAEEVVLTARSKVEDALSVARNVSATLDQHLSNSVVSNKPLVLSQVANIGVFEVKSDADKKGTSAPKQRLKQANLPPISIKRGLDKQSIPTVQVLPGEKLTPTNVSVYSVKHDDKVREDNFPGDTESKKNLEHSSLNNHAATSCSASDLKCAIAELSKQLADVEELRELNQAQVNHVLQFLMSRVCTATCAIPEKPKDTVDDGTQVENAVVSKTSPTSTLTSSSENSKYPIAYDSLSRFLETYKRAAEQNMLSQKRAALRRQKVALRQKKDIEQAESERTHHLLIGPLRQIGSSFKNGLSSSEERVQSSNHSSQIPFRLEREAVTSILSDNTPNSILISDDKDGIVSNHEKDSLSTSPPEITSDFSSVHNSSANLQPKSIEGVTGDEYEEDWEEEENVREQTGSDVQRANSGDGLLKPISEAEEHLSTVSHSMNERSLQLQPPCENIEADIESLHLSAQKNSDLSRSKSSTEEQNLTKKHQSLFVVNEVASKIFEDKQQRLSVLSATSPSPPSHPTGNDLRFTILSSETKEAMQISPCEKPDDISNLLSQSHDQILLTDNIGSKESKAGAHHNVSEKQSKRSRARTRHIEVSSSSSDTEFSALKNKRRDLKLREDLQLQSAILLNWQLEDRWTKVQEKTSSKDPVPTHESEVFAEVASRWQRTLDQLDHRLKTIEENERIHRIAQEIRMQAREELAKVSVTESVAKVKDIDNAGSKDTIDSNSKIPMKDQMIQTSLDGVEPHKEKFTALKRFQEIQPTPLYFKESRIVDNHLKCSTLPVSNDDLTEELLAYSRMGIISGLGCPVQTQSKSPSSSTSSSQLHPSSLLVSWSDGELHGSGSCSCSEGEFCLCGGRKVCSERLPPDGSQTFSDGENFLRDVSQGEIPYSEIKNIIDTSNGEIADPNSTSLLPDDLDADKEDKTESDNADWEL